MKILDFIKKLFNADNQSAVLNEKNIPGEKIQAPDILQPKTSTNVTYAKHDIFGSLITNDDKFIPIAYNDIKRRGYITLFADYKIYVGDDIRFFKRVQVIKYDTFKELVCKNGLFLVKRNGCEFYHLYC